MYMHTLGYTLATDNRTSKKKKKKGVLTLHNLIEKSGMGKEERAVPCTGEPFPFLPYMYTHE